MLPFLPAENVTNKDGFYITENVVGLNAATATNYGVFFIARNPCEILWCAEAHTTAGTNGGAVTLNIEKLTGTQALDAGSTVLVTAWDLKGAINTVSTKEISALQNQQLAPGDRLALKDVGTLTDVAGVQVTVYLKTLGKGDFR